MSTQWIRTLASELEERTSASEGNKTKDLKTNAATFLEDLF
jgi:hypothetical protein